MNPMRNANRFKLGLFSINADGGTAFTKVGNRWRADWSEIEQAVQKADAAGLEFILPIARWKGYGGETNVRAASFETLTHAAALSAVYPQHHQRMKEAHYGAVEPDVMQLERRRYAGGTGSYPLVGTPEQIADEMIAMHKLGLAGVTVSFVNVNDELPFFVERVLPLLEQAGLRGATRQ